MAKFSTHEDGLNQDPGLMSHCSPTPASPHHGLPDMDETTSGATDISDLRLGEVQVNLCQIWKDCFGALDGVERVGVGAEKEMERSKKGKELSGKVQMNFR
eukprot:g36184.t1